MKPSNLFITSLLAAAAMSVPAYATSLSDATLSIESFTQANIDALGTAGWTVSGITISRTDGTFTTTAGTQPSIIAADGSSNTLSTNVSTGSATARYTFSTIVTVDASLFSGTSSGNIIAGSMVSNGTVSTSNDIGVGFSSGTITGVYSNVVWNNSGNRTLDVSDSIVNGKVTIGLVFRGDSGVDLYLTDGSTVNISGLKTGNNYNAISLSDSTSVTYSNLYWFNSALSASDMQTAVVNAASTGARQAALTWAGGASGTWDYASDANWTMSGESGTVSTAFQDWDGVTFATDGAQVELTQSSGFYWLKDLTVSAATSLTGTGTIRVDAANLTTTAALTLGENVVLNLGSSASATNKNILGAGTVKFVSTAAGHGGTLTLGNGFTGTIEYSGKFNTSNGTNNANAKFALSNGSMWGGSGTNTLANDIHFLTNYQIGDTTATTIVLNGNLTQADGTTLTIGTNANTNITFGGAGTVISDLRISAGKLTMNAGQATIKGSQSLVGNLEINSGATVYVGQTDSLNYGGTNTITVNQGGVLDFGGYRWTVGSNNKIVLGGGTIKGTGDANGALDFYRSATVEASAGTTSEISATVKIRNEQEGTKATFTVGADAKLEVSGTIKGDGALQKNGTGELVVSETNVYTGGTTVNGGVLTVKNATALGTTAGTTTLNSGGVLKIAVNGGLTAGMVTLNEGALLAIDLTAYSNIEEGTALTIISSSAISFNSQEFSSDLMENTFFDLENSNLGSWSSYLREWSYDTTNGLRLTLTIPEPSTFGLLAGLGALALAGTRRRRREKLKV